MMENYLQKSDINKVQTTLIDGCEVRYILKPSKIDSTHLVVMFNGYRFGGFDFTNSSSFSSIASGIFEVFSFYGHCATGSLHSLKIQFVQII